MLKLVMMLTLKPRSPLITRGYIPPSFIHSSNGSINVIEDLPGPVPQIEVQILPTK